MSLLAQFLLFSKWRFFLPTPLLLFNFKKVFFPLFFFRRTSWMKWIELRTKSGGEAAAGLVVTKSRCRAAGPARPLFYSIFAARRRPYAPR